jgi:hypothetical protein
MRTNSWRPVLVLVLGAALLDIGCRGADIGKPTDEEVTQMQAWAEVVTPKDRDVVTREANQHTDWAERRKVQFITGEYKKRFLHFKAHPSTTQSTTSPTTGASGGL